MSEDPLLIKLQRLLEKSQSAAHTSGGFWVGDKAGERQVLDDLRAGRLWLHSVHLHAKAGIEAIRAEDRETAELEASVATDCYIEALEAFLSKVRPSDRQSLTKPAKRRGRPSKKS